MLKRERRAVLRAARPESPSAASACRELAEKRVVEVIRRRDRTGPLTQSLLRAPAPGQNRAFEIPIRLPPTALRQEADIPYLPMPGRQTIALPQADLPPSYS